MPLQTSLWLIGFSPEDGAQWQRLLAQALPHTDTQLITPPIVQCTVTEGVFAIILHTASIIGTLPEGLAGVILSHHPIPADERGRLLHLMLPLRFTALLAVITRWQQDTPALLTLALNAHWSLDRQRRELVSDHGSIALTDKESELLAALLMASTPDGIAREALLKQIWGYHEQIDSHTLETHIYRLRTKLQPALHAGQGILTTPQGYRLATSL